MKIVVLAYNLVHAGALSVGKNIIGLLPKVCPQHHYLFVVPEGKGYPSFKEMSNVQVVKVPHYRLPGRLLFEQYTLPKMMREYSPDFVWGLGNLGMVDPPCRQAVLIHQAHLVYPTLHYGMIPLRERVKNDYCLKKRVSAYLKKTDIIFCQTPIMKKRFSESFDFPLEKIFILPNAVSQFSKTGVCENSVPDVCRDSQTFDLFFLSRFYSHKNPSIMIELFRQYSKELSDVRCIVTIESNQISWADKFLSKIEKYKLENKIINVGSISQRELAGYFKNTQALFLHTLMESFSGTYLEAMYYGLPILTSDLDFAQYICGPAAIYFDPWNLEDIKNKIIQLKDNVELRSKMIESGKVQFQDFAAEWDEIVAGAMQSIECANSN